jgi:hypothetical protein
MPQKTHCMSITKADRLMPFREIVAGIRGSSGEGCERFSTVGSQQPAITRHRPVNNDRGMVFSAQSVPMAVHSTMEHVMPSLSNSYSAKEERCFLYGPSGAM